MSSSYQDVQLDFLLLYTKTEFSSLRVCCVCVSVGDNKTNHLFCCSNTLNHSPHNNQPFDNLFGWTSQVLGPNQINSSIFTLFYFITFFPMSFFFFFMAHNCIVSIVIDSWKLSPGVIKLIFVFLVWKWSTNKDVIAYNNAYCMSLSFMFLPFCWWWWMASSVDGWQRLTFIINNNNIFIHFLFVNVT